MNNDYEYQNKQQIKNICYNPDTNTIRFITNNNISYLCNIFGQKLPIFKKNLSGFINGQQRKKLSSSNESKQIDNNSYDKSNEYYPTVRRFEGYNHFPRPKCPPFTNIPNFLFKEKLKRELINILKKNFFVEKNKKDVTIKNKNSGLSYLTSDICGYIKNNDNENSYNNNFLINLIDNTIEEYKTKTELDSKELYLQYPLIRALIYIKKFISINKDTNVINGRKLKPPNPEIINDYKIIHKLLFEYKNKNKKSQSLMDILNQGSIDNININNNKNNSFTSSNKILLKNLEKNNFLAKLNIPNLKNSISKFSNFNSSANSMDNINYISNRKVNSSIYDELETNESNNNINVSLISKINEKDKKNVIKFNKKIKTYEILRKYTEKERKLLKGFQKEIVKKKGTFQKYPENHKFKISGGDVYKKEINIMKINNPVAFEMMKKKEALDMKKLMEKKRFSIMNDKFNLMKAKKIIRSSSACC